VVAIEPTVPVGFPPIADISRRALSAVLSRPWSNTDALANIGHAAEEAGNYKLARQSFERGAELGGVICLYNRGNATTQRLRGPVWRPRSPFDLAACRPRQALLTRDEAPDQCER
jgi:hypothetical protein